MRRMIVAPETGVLEAIPEEPAPDRSDAAAFVWIDLDRSEAARLGALPIGLPTAIARGLIDAAPGPRFEQHDAFRRLSVLAVEEAHRAGSLADLDIVEGPNLLITVHAGARPALEHLIGRTIRFRSDPGSPFGHAVALLLETVVDGYDQLISEAEAEVDKLRQGPAAGGRTRTGPDDLFRIRRRMMTLERRLIAQRDVFADYAASLPSPDAVDRLRRIPDRIAPVIQRSLLAAEYAQDGAMSLRRAAARGPIVAVVLGASWLTFLATVLIMSLATTRGSEGLPTGFLAGVVILGSVSAAVLLFARSRRWL